jgi:hypothetical protein
MNFLTNLMTMNFEGNRQSQQTTTIKTLRH